MGYRYDAATGAFVDEATGAAAPAPTSGMPAPKNGAFNEIGTGIKRGAVVELPKMIGMGMKATGRPGDTLYDAGQGIVSGAEERGKAPQNQLNPDGHGWFVNALASGGEMLAPSAAGMVAAVPLALAGAPTAALAAGAVATGGLFGASQFQETYENVKGAGGDDKSAFKAGLLSGAIEAGGEGLASYIGGKFVTRAGSAIVGKTLDSGLKGMAAPGILKPFASGYAKTLGVEVGTEMGQNAGEAAVENAYGVKEANPWESAKAAIAPTFGLTTLLAPFGLHANIKQARQIKNDVATITGGDVNDYQARSDSVNRLGTLLDNSPPPGMTEKEWRTQVNDWRMTALEAANSGQPIDADTLLSGGLKAKAGQFAAAKQFEEKAAQDAVVARDPNAQVYDDFGNPIAAPLPVTKGATATFGANKTPGTVVDVTDTSVTIKHADDGRFTTLDTPEAMASVKIVPPEVAAAAATGSAHGSGLNVGDPVKLGGEDGTVVEQDSKFAGKGSVSVRMADGTIRHLPADQVHTGLSSDSPKVQARIDEAFAKTPTGAAAAKDAKKQADDAEKKRKADEAAAAKAAKGTVDVKTMTQDEYAKHLIENGLPEGVSAYDALTAHPELRGMTAQQRIDHFGANQEAVKGFRQRIEDLWQRVRGAPEDKIKAIGADSSWTNFEVGADTHTTGTVRHKSYATIKDFINTSDAELTGFLRALRDAGYNGQVKFPGVGARALLGFDNVVMHGATEADAKLGEKVARLHFGDKISGTQFGTDATKNVGNDKGKSHTEILAEKVDAEIKKKSTTTAAKPFAEGEETVLTPTDTKGEDHGQVQKTTEEVLKTAKELKVSQAASTEAATTIADYLKNTEAPAERASAMEKLAQDFETEAAKEKSPARVKHKAKVARAYANQLNKEQENVQATNVSKGTKSESAKNEAGAKTPAPAQGHDAANAKNDGLVEPKAFVSNANEEEIAAKIKALRETKEPEKLKLAQAISKEQYDRRQRTSPKMPSGLEKPIPQDKPTVPPAMPANAGPQREPVVEKPPTKAALNKADQEAVKEGTAEALLARAAVYTKLGNAHPGWHRGKVSLQHLTKEERLELKHERAFQKRALHFTKRASEVRTTAQQEAVRKARGVVEMTDEAAQRLTDGMSMEKATQVLKAKNVAEAPRTPEQILAAANERGVMAPTEALKADIAKAKADAAEATAAHDKAKKDLVTARIVSTALGKEVVKLANKAATDSDFTELAQKTAELVDAKAATVQAVVAEELARKDKMEAKDRVVELDEAKKDAVLQDREERASAKKDGFFAFEMFDYDPNADRNGRNFLWANSVMDAIRASVKAGKVGENARDALQYLTAWHGADILNIAERRMQELEKVFRLQRNMRETISVNLKSLYDQLGYAMEKGQREEFADSNGEARPELSKKDQMEISDKLASLVDKWNNPKENVAYDENGNAYQPDVLPYLASKLQGFTNLGIRDALIAANGTNDMALVMDAVVLHASGKPMKALAAAFKSLVGGIKVLYKDVIMPSGSRKDGEASLKHGNFNTIRNDATYYKGGENAHVVLHETAHGLSVYELRKAEAERAAGGKPKSQEAARRAVALRNLEAMRGFLEGRKELAGQYAFKNNAEFIAEVWTNAKFQSLLKSIEIPAGMLEQMPARSMTAFDAVVAVMKNMLGLADKHTSALSQALDITGEFFVPNTEVTAPRLVAEEGQRKQDRGAQNFASASAQMVDRAQLLQRVEDAIKQVGDRAEKETGYRWKTLPADKAALASLNKTRTAIVTAQTRGLNAVADASYASIKGGPSLAETLSALAQATRESIAVVRDSVLRPTLADYSFDSLSTPSAAFAETATGVEEVISNAKNVISKAIGKWDTMPKLRQLGLYLSTTKNMESRIHTSADLHPLEPAFNLWFTADELKTRVIGHLNKFLYADHLSAVQNALSKMKDPRKVNADMGHAASEISLISEEIGYAIDPRKDFAGNKAAHPTLDPVLRDRVNALNEAHTALPAEARKLIDHGFMATRRAHIEFSASRLLSALQNTQHSPSSAASAAETMVNKYGKLLDVLEPAAGTTITDPKLFMDAKTSELDKHMRDAFDDIHRAFGGEDLQEAFDAMAKEYKRSVASPYQFQNRPGNYFVSFDVANTTPANIAKVNRALEPFGVKVGGFPGGSKHVYMKMQSQVEMNATVHALAKLGAAIEGKVEAGKTSDAGRMATAFGAASAVNRLRESMIARYEELRQAGSMTKDMQVAKEQAIAFINSSFIDLIEGDSARTTMTKRKGIPGADTNYQKTFAKRGEFYVSLISNQYAQPHFDKSFRDMKAEIKVLQEENHNAGVRGQEVMDELTTRTNNAMNPVDAPIVRTITAFGYHFFLSLSPAFAAVNLLQPSHLTLPLLGGRYGFVKSAMAIMNASAMAFKIITKSWGKAWAEGGFFAAAEAKLDLEGLGMTPGQVALTQHMIEGGTLSSSMTHELGRMAEGDDRRVANAAKAMGVMTHYSEVMNRLTAGLAAYNLATENKYTRKDGTEMSTDEDAKTKYAIGVVNQTQFLYSDHNTARAIGRHGIAGKLTPMLASFQNYAFQMMEHYIRLVDQGWFNKSAQLSDVERKEARKALYGTLGMTSIIAGTMGLPFANVVAAVANGLAGDDDKEDIRNQYRNFLEMVFGKDVAEVVAHGAFRAAGIDISASSGHQDLLPGTRFLADRRKFEDKVKDGSLSLMGPGLNAALDVVGGLSHIADGDLRQGFEVALPRALKGYFKAAALADQGAFTDKAGNKLPIPVDNWDILWQSLGFTPAKKAEHSEANFYYQAEQNLTKQAKARMVNDAVKAYENGDMEEFAQQRLAIQEYNMRNPMNPITDLAASLAGRARGRAYAAMQPAAIIDRNAKHLPQISQYSWANTRNQQ